ncbi:hypothetical protein, partial [Athalassotoga sp.]|uniref:hypothetical protein n=1 Tax=Athalassotoga sp. TaxID=2022597 RepID=UPI003CFE7A3C
RQEEKSINIQMLKWDSVSQIKIYISILKEPRVMLPCIDPSSYKLNGNIALAKNRKKPPIGSF